MAKTLGMGGSITVSSVSYPVKVWALNGTNDVQEVTDTGSGGWVARMAGVSSAELTFTGFWGAGATSFGTTFTLGASLVVSLPIGAAVATGTGTFLVSGASITNDAKSPAEFQCTAQSTGTVTMPT